MSQSSDEIHHQLLPNLPEELLDKIFSFVDNAETLLLLAKQCRRFNSLSLDNLYHLLDVHRNRAYHWAWTALYVQADAGQEHSLHWIFRARVIDLSAPTLTTIIVTFSEPSANTNVPWQMTQTAQLVRAFPAISTVTIHQNLYFKNLVQDQYLNAYEKAWYDLLSSIGASSCSSFSVHGHFPSIARMTNKEATPCKTLRRLEIGYDAVFASLGLVKNWIIASANLSPVTDFLSSWQMDEDVLRQLSLPHIRSLQLGAVDIRDLEEFLDRHPSTVSLHLQNPPAIPSRPKLWSTTSLSKLTTLRGDADHIDYILSMSKSILPALFSILIDFCQGAVVVPTPEKMVSVLRAVANYPTVTNLGISFPSTSAFCTFLGDEEASILPHVEVLNLEHGILTVPLTVMDTPQEHFARLLPRWIILTFPSLTQLSYQRFPSWKRRGADEFITEIKKRYPSIQKVSLWPLV